MVTLDDNVGMCRVAVKLLNIEVEKIILRVVCSTESTVYPFIPALKSVLRTTLLDPNPMTYS